MSADELQELLGDDRYIVIFDGVCNFCNGAVNFIINRDPQGLFAFAPIQSPLAHALMMQYQVTDNGLETFFLIKNEQCFSYSSAAVEIAKDLTGCWSLLRFSKVIPVAIRDFFYRILARNRYRLFGRRASCMLPNEEVRSRFVGI